MGARAGRALQRRLRCVDDLGMTRTDLRRSLGWALVVSLTIAAFTASIAIVSGDFSDGDARVIGTSLGFAVFSAFAAAGGSMRLEMRLGRTSSPR